MPLLGVSMTNTQCQRMLRMPAFVEFVLPPPTSSPMNFFLLAISLGRGQILQNFNFSSPAPVHTTSPAGATQLNSTLESWASRISATVSKRGKAWMMIECLGDPCVVNSSFACGAHWMDVICDGVRKVCRRAPVVLFQIFIVASFVPPPDASQEGCQGHHATACNVLFR